MKSQTSINWTKSYSNYIAFIELGVAIIRLELVLLSSGKYMSLVDIVNKREQFPVPLNLWDGQFATMSEAELAILDVISSMRNNLNAFIEVCD